MRPQPKTTSGRRIPAAATVMQEQAEKKWHGTREHAAQAQTGISLGKRAHTHTLSKQLRPIFSSSKAADLRVMTIEPRESDRNSHVPWARLL